MKTSDGSFNDPVDEGNPSLNSRPRSRAAVLKSTELFRGAKEILIEHANTYYRLIITKAGKLILNK